MRGGGGGGGCGDSAKEYSSAHGAQINFGYLTNSIHMLPLQLRITNKLLAVRPVELTQKLLTSYIEYIVTVIPAAINPYFCLKNCACETTIYNDVISCLAPIQSNGGPVHVVPVFPASKTFHSCFIRLGRNCMIHPCTLSTPLPILFCTPIISVLLSV
jgi:hypothetical protein